MSLKALLKSFNSRPQSGAFCIWCSSRASISSRDLDASTYQSQRNKVLGVSDPCDTKSEGSELGGDQSQISALGEDGRLGLLSFSLLLLFMLCTH